ncbi:Pkinase-domain-containing protein [Neocallimastix lanati (nom. inval.)]|jgi:3-phosphoinositide dependent protein kinase-1|uniref:non-specific serine/threonine protein kinase n=1 Tax=Neocallimastix californiae TaxID=1754190 RepID=A0A1Y1ZNY7_9FUNG|nr:Pkinase-domain-containing protein [Neocallimastix sp. JGI-2020a]ORY11948.1 Pkinase-domain-containing protein [Neocallimastix californiae]|eukprot:ORY11948.1 Pkinase-domain-containing protein [Neocallimastix californiae]
MSTNTSTSSLQQPPSGNQSPGEQRPQPRKRTPQDFDFFETIGEGSYSTVTHAREKSTGKEFAIKILNKKHIIKEKKVKYVNVEKTVLNKIHNHPLIVKLYYTFQDKYSLYFVLDLAEKGDLLGYIHKMGSFDLECTKFYVAEVVSALEYLHKKDIIHRDLKPENILITQNMHIKLTDFGTAKIIENEEDNNRANSFVGTAEYVSPELLNDKATCKSSDFWALGCIIYQLLAGRPPFKASNEYQTFQKILKMEYTLPDEIPEVAKDLIKKLLVEDPNHRIGADTPEGGGYEALKSHPFFEGIVWENIHLQTPPELKPNPAVHFEKKSTSSLNEEPEFLYENNNELYYNQGSADFSKPDPEPESQPVYQENQNVQDEDKLFEQQQRERRRLIEEQRKNLAFADLLSPNEFVVRYSFVNLKQGFFVKKRILVLTDQPCLLIFHESKLEIKGQVAITSESTIKQKDNTHLSIITDGKKSSIEFFEEEATVWNTDLTKYFLS